MLFLTGRQDVPLLCFKFFIRKRAGLAQMVQALEPVEFGVVTHAAAFLPVILV